MLTFLTNFIIGTIEDSVGLFIYPRLFDPWSKTYTNLIGYPDGQTLFVLNDNQPIFQALYYTLASRMNPILFFNLVVLITAILILIFSYFAFKLFIKNRFISVLMSILFIFSGYVSTQIKSHLDLAQIWLFPALILLLLKQDFKFKYIFLGLFLSIAVGVSNYIGFFLLLFIGMYILSKQLINKFILHSNFWDKKLIANYLVSFLVFLTFSLIFLTPYIKAQYVGSKLEETKYSISRPIEDFVIFSSRPWYYLLPSTNSLILGKFSTWAIESLQTDWGYYLTFNHFENEHSASFLGYTNIIFATLGFIYMLNRFTKRSENSTHLAEIFTIGLTSFFLFILTMPPMFTVAGKTIYLPSYIIWTIFPMFRSLSRLSTLIVFITLIYTGIGYTVLLNTLFKSIHGILPTVSDWIKKLSTYAIIVIIFIIAVAEFYTPIEIVDVSDPPKVYSFVKNIKESDTPIAVYPYGKTRMALFWLGAYKKPLMNPRSFDYKYDNTNSESFTEYLTECEGLVKAQSIGLEYLIVFENSITQEAKQKIDLYVKDGILKLEGNFDELPYQDNRSDFLKRFVEISGVNESDSASIYSISEDRLKNNCHTAQI